MKIVSENVEYRRTNVVEGKNGKYYMHTFEDENNSLQFYCKEPVSLNKGDVCKVVFQVGLYNGKPNFNMIGVENGNK